MESKLCRLCCKNKATSFIFHKQPNGMQLSEKIMYCCAKITISDEDGLPSFVCDGCEHELNACYQFVLKCEESNRQLHAQSLAIFSQDFTKLYDSAHPIDVKIEVNCLSDFEHHYEDHHSDDTPVEQVKHEIEIELGTNYEESRSDIPLESLPHDIETIKTENTKPKIPVRKSKPRTKYKALSPANCTICGRQCISQSSLIIHMRSHTNEHPFPCSLCDKKYKDSGNLKRHINRKHSDQRKRNFICETCGKGFFSKSDVNIHMRTHTGETPYECTECSARFSQLGAMLRHKTRHSGKREHLCPICSKKFWTKQELNMHSGVHSTEKKYQCTICNTAFKYQSNLTKHKRLHTEAKVFICNYCGRDFKFKGNLKSHINKQHSEKSGYCEVCSRHAPNIETHLWRHTGKRPLKCEFCPSSFFDLQTLGRHVNFKHTKTDKYKCDVEGCSMVFPSRPMLDFHTAKLHGTHIPFPCDRCNRAFYRKNDLARHKIGTHKERLI